MQSCTNKEQVIADAGSVTIHSGNILHKILRTSQEICQSFCGTVKQWTADKSEIPSITTQCSHGGVFINNEKDTEWSKERNRDDIKLTVKLFLWKNDAEIVKEAVLTVIDYYQCEKIDLLLLSLPPTSNCPHNTFRSVKYQDIREVWIQLCNLAADGFITELGVCDMDEPSLKDICESSDVKPVANQINLQECCHPPKNLSAYASEHHIKLLTHNDPNDVLPEDTLQFVLPASDKNRSWKACFLTRYSAVIRLREIVMLKGYFLCMKATKES
ncbi:unnamed protein product [Clavelina lepadiformis]|uniref:GCS light chain n=1 Tax=Clavelina lepadiformis TaxID=159417 RepID=A0ABP0F934_CLALP